MTVLQIAQLRLPGDMAKRMASAHVRSRARSISEHGLIHRPIVRRENWEVIAGCDRIAACMLLGWDSVDCDVRDMSREDAAVFARVDNADRRHDPEEQRREAVELEAAVRRRLEVQGLPAGARSADAVVRQEVAAELGMKEETLRKRQQRSRKREDIPGATELPKGFTPGPLLDALREQVCKAANLLDAADRHVASALQELRAAKKIGVALPRVERLEDALKGAQHAMRQACPKCVCPYCNGRDTQPFGCECAACDGRGWIDAAGERQLRDLGI